MLSECFFPNQKLPCCKFLVKIELDNIKISCINLTSRKPGDYGLSFQGYNI